MTEETVFIKMVTNRVNEILLYITTRGVSFNAEIVPQIKQLKNLITKYQKEAKESRNSTRQYNMGTSDYSTKQIQPWDIWLDSQLNPWDADIIKRIMRNKKDKSLTSAEQRILDYQKIQHICQERIDQIENGDEYYKDKRDFLSSAILNNMTAEEFTLYFSTRSDLTEVEQILFKRLLKTDIDKPDYLSDNPL